MSEIRSILRNTMKEKLAAGQTVASMTVRFSRSIEIAQIARTAGFDTLYVDLEHNTLSIDTCCQICISAQQIGLTPLVRVPANTPEYIGRVLDGGAMGVITPHVRSAAEARAMVDLVKFPPLGHRSAGGALSLPVPQLPRRRDQCRDERGNVAGGDDGNDRRAGKRRGNHRRRRRGYAVNWK